MLRKSLPEIAASSKDASLVEHFASGRASAYQQYQQMFVGKQGLLPLLRYELLVSFASSCPGALGYWLRKACFRRILAEVGSGSLFGRGVVLRNPGGIRLGESVIVDDLVVMDAKGDRSSIQLGDEILIGRSCVLSCHDSRITMGSSVSIGPFCYMGSKSFIDIGSNVAIGSGTHILAGSHATDDPEIPIRQQPRISLGIAIEDNVWIGSGARILDGVRIGRNSIVGACAMVNKDVPPYAVVLGNPARVVQTRKAG